MKRPIVVRRREQPSRAAETAPPTAAVGSLGDEGREVALAEGYTVTAWTSEDGETWRQMPAAWQEER